MPSRSGSPSSRSRPPSPAARRRQAVITAVALAVIGAVFVVTWLINHRGDDASSASKAATSTSAASTSATVAAEKDSATSSSKTSGSRRPSARPRSTRASSQPSATIPARVRTTLALIDAGKWPAAANAPGTHGGDVFRNNERQLPVTDASGARITYREWDVNPKRRGSGRDAERIVTGSDGSAWYTADHYRTFVVVRGPR